MTRQNDERTERLELRIEKTTLQSLDALRRAADDLPSRGEMVRRLITDAAAELDEDMSVTAVTRRRK